jgi:hypothetical protein
LPTRYYWIESEKKEPGGTNEEIIKQKCPFSMMKLPEKIKGNQKMKET